MFMYWRGILPRHAAHDGGRSTIFAVVPPWLEEFAPYPATARDGSRNLLLVNEDGRRPGESGAL